MAEQKSADEKSSSSSDGSRKRSRDNSEDDDFVEKPSDSSLFRGRFSTSSESRSPTPRSRYTEDFEEIQLLGKGGYGVVYQCKHKLDEKMYAVKKIPFNIQKLERYLREVRILAGLEHPGVMRYYQCWIEDGIPDSGSSEENDLLDGATKTLFVVMEVCNSTLHDKLKDETKIVEEVAWRYFGEILQGLQFIHGSGTIHADLSRDNIFFDAHDRVKIGDFGLARSCGDNMSKSLGNPIYQAPELLLRPSSISEKSDIFALGLVLFEMYHPMKTEAERNHEFKALREFNTVTGHNANKMISQIIKRLLSEDPADRPSAADLILEYFP